ncbi:MAG: hypothetical protein RR313_12165 [Anaerovoracaceae bacterium]
MKIVPLVGEFPCRWNMDNIFIRTDPAGNIKADSGASVYDERGILSI